MRKTAAEAKLAAGPGGARQAEGSEAWRRCLPSGAAGPGSEAAAMWPHMAAVPLAATKRQRNKWSFQAGRLLRVRANGSSRSEASGPGGRGAGAGLRRLTEAVIEFFKLELYLSSLIIVLCILLGGQNGQSRSENLAGLERSKWPVSLDDVFSKRKP